MKFAIIVALVAFSSLASASLRDDLHEFAEIIPVQEMREIARRYAATDAEVQQAIKYLQGPKWAELVSTVASNPSWQHFKKYLAEAGIDIEEIVKAIHEIIAGAGHSKHVIAVHTVRKFVDEIKAVFPKGKFLALLDDKLSNSEEFQAFWTKVTSEKAHKLVDDVRAIPEVHRIADVVRAWGIDLDKALDLIYALLGWE